MSKRYLLLFILSLSVCSINSQDNEYIKDSLTKRFIAIMDKYNESVIYTDTSEYATNYPEALNTNLQIASSKGFCREIARLYVKGARINSSSYEKATPLHFAVSADKTDAAEILLLLGARRQEQDIYGITPLAIAAQNDNVELAEILIRYGAATDTSDNDGAVPLHYAVSNNSFYMTDLLLYYGANTDKTDNKGNTPLILAVWNGNFEIADILLQAGANPDISDKKGFTPYIAASQRADTLMLTLLQNAGADIYKYNSNGYDALCVAIRNGDTETVNYLLRVGNLWFEKRDGKVDPATVIERYGARGMNFPQKIKTTAAFKASGFNQATISVGGTAATHLGLITGELALRNPSLRGGFFASYSFNPVSSKVLVESSESFYQYRLQIKTIEAGIFKELSTRRTISRGEWITYASLSGAYRIYSEYNGTVSKPENKFCLVPSIGLKYNFNRFSVSSELSYMSTPFYKVSPLWLSLKLSVNLFSDDLENVRKK